MVFVDTPGFQTRYSNALNRAMNRAVTGTLADVDAIVMVIEASGWDERDDPVLALIPPGARVVLAVNKVDRVRDKAKLAQLLAACAARRDFAALVPVSAEKGTQVKALAGEVAAPAARERAALRRRRRSPTARSASSPRSSCARSSSACWATSCPTPRPW